MLHAGLRHLNTPEAVNFWTDFTQVPLSTKAVFSLPGIWHGSTSFGGFAQGMGILTLEDREDILDRARLLGEACDSPQVTCPLSYRPSQAQAHVLKSCCLIHTACGRCPSQALLMRQSQQRASLALLPTSLICNSGLLAS